MWKFVAREALSYALHGALGAAGTTLPRFHGDGPTVLFVHGHGGGPGAFALLERSLRRSGWKRFAGWEYRSSGSVARVAEDLARYVAANVPGEVVVVGHSMGGIVARYWLQELGGRARTRGLVTLSSPHAGLRHIPGARLLPLVRELRRGSALFAALERSAGRLSGLPSLAVVSTRDHFVGDPEHATFPHARLVKVDHAGHVGVLFSRRVHALVAEHLDSVAQAS